MKNIIIIIAFLLGNTSVVAQKNDDFIRFDKRVEWNSFKGIPDNDTTGARISTSIYLEVVRTNIWYNSL